MPYVEKILRRFDRAHRQVPVAIAALVLLGAMLIGSSWIAQAADENVATRQAWYVHTQDVLIAKSRTEIAANKLLRGERGYVLTDNPVYLVPYDEGRQELPLAIADLDRLTSDNPDQRQPVDSLVGLSNTLISRTAAIVAAKRAGRDADALALVQNYEGRAALLAIGDALHQIGATEQTLLAERGARAEEARKWQHGFGLLVTAAGLFTLVFAALAVVALRRAFAREAIYRDQLRIIALTDELTGIANRREVMQGLDRAVAAARRRGEPLAVAVLDIDHFKRVNDTWGHSAGDKVIRTVAHIALSALRGSDLVGRIGGEEFLLVMPGAGISQAYTVCERLRQEVQAKAIELPDGALVEVTVSTGVARLYDGDDAAALVQRADEALYAAKQGGRDQVRLAA